MKDNENAIRPEFLRLISDTGDINNLKEKIDLTRFKINEAEFAALAAAMKVQNKVTALNLAFSGINAENEKHLIAILENNHSLKELDLSGNNITGDIIQAIENAPSLTSLNLIRVTFDENVMELLANTKITSLNIITDEVTREEVIAFAKALKNNKTLTSFQLGRASVVNNTVVEAFADALKENDTLTSFSVSGGRISDRGAGVLAAALKKNHTLKSIVLGGEVTFKGVNYFATALENNQTLTTLGLSCPNSTAVTNLLERNKKFAIKKTAREKNEKLEKFKAVVFIGPGVEYAEQAIKAKYGKRKDVKIIVGKVSDIDFSEIYSRTDKDTMFIIAAHGINEEDHTKTFSHFINGQPTDKFLNKLKEEAGHDINAVLFACHGGGTLKFGKVNSGITLMTKASSKYTTLVSQSTETMLKILKLKTGKQNVSNQDIYRMLPSEDMETYYYRGGNEGDKTTKFPKIIKFSLKKIEEYLEKSKFTKDQQNKIFESLSEDLKIKNITRNFSTTEIFSITEIKKKIDDPDLGIDKTLRDNFVKKLEFDALQKLSPENIKDFLKNRTANIFGTEDIVSEIAPVDMLEVLLMACSRGDLNFTKFILYHNPDLINRSNKNGSSPISVTISGNNKNTLRTIQMLIDNGLDIDAKDTKGYTPLMYVARSGEVEIVKLLLDNDAKVDVKDNDFGKTAIDWAESSNVKDENKKEIIRLLNEAQKNQSEVATEKTTSETTTPQVPSHDPSHTKVQPLHNDDDDKGR